MGVAGGLFPSPLHLIALAQIALGRRARAVGILIGPPLAVDGMLLAITFFFYQYVPKRIAHDIAYVGGVTVMAIAIYSLAEMRRKSKEALAESSMLTYAGVTAATLAELTAPGTWIYWLTFAGPILAEGRLRGYWHVVPFFAGSLIGYYGAAVISLLLLAWGASLHRYFKRYLFLIANLLLIVLGISYLIRARGQ